jgi:hypothetical protein
MGRERFLFVPFPLPCGSALGILTYPVGRVGVIHPSAWNRNSANFAFWGFSEVRIHGVLRSSRLACGGGIMIVVERVGLLLESGSERRTLYVCGRKQGGLQAHP